MYSVYTLHVNANRHLCLRSTCTGEREGEQCNMGGKRKKINVPLDLHVSSPFLEYTWYALSEISEEKEIRVSLPLMGEWGEKETQRRSNWWSDRSPTETNKVLIAKQRHEKRKREQRAMKETCWIGSVQCNWVVYIYLVRVHIGVAIVTEGYIACRSQLLCFPSPSSVALNGLHRRVQNKQSYEAKGTDTAVLKFPSRAHSLTHNRHANHFVLFLIHHALLVYPSWNTMHH